MSVPASVPRIVSVRAGQVREWPRPDWDQAANRRWRSAYQKEELAGPVHVGVLGVDGDQQFDRSVHGGPDKAVLAYAAAHYAEWRRMPGLEAIGPGGFGENLVIEGADEATQCIGDVLAAGAVRVQISQPRGPCANISRRWNAPWLLDAVTENGRVGWYLRVLAEGTLAAGDAYALAERPHPEFPVARVLRLRLGAEIDPAASAALAACEVLPDGWRKRFARQVRQAE